MALKPTAWGNAHLEYGTPGANDALPTTWTDMGCILDQTIAVNVTEGTALEIRCSGNRLADQQDVEATYQLAFSLQGVASEIMTEFWGTATPGADGITWVKSTITPERYAFRLSVPDVPGSDTFVIPRGSITLRPAFADNAGFSLTATISLLTSQLGIFGFGVVPDPGA